jgi:hypothetical protein
MNNYIVGNLKIAQITENSLLHEVDETLKNRESFVDNEIGMSERIYSADIFSNILEDTKVSKKCRSQLNDLNNQTSEYNYVMIIDCKVN